MDTMVLSVLLHIRYNEFDNHGEYPKQYIYNTISIKGSQEKISYFYPFFTHG